MLCCAGFREAEAVAKAELESAAFSNVADPQTFRQDLLNIARTTLSSKILTADKDHFAELAVTAIMRLKGTGNLESIHIIKKPGGALKVRFSSGAVCQECQLTLSSSLGNCCSIHDICSTAYMSSKSLAAPSKYAAAVVLTSSAVCHECRVYITM